MICNLVYPFLVEEPTLKDYYTANGRGVHYLKMYDNYHTLPWKSAWYAAYGIPKDRACSLLITTEATYNSGQFTVKAFGTVEMGIERVASAYIASLLTTVLYFRRLYISIDV